MRSLPIPVELDESQWPPDIPREEPPADQLYRYIGYHIATERILQRVSRRQLAQMAGCSLDTLTRCERGRTKTELTHLLAIAESLGAPLSMFLPGDRTLRGTIALMRDLCPSDKQCILARAAYLAKAGPCPTCYREGQDRQLRALLEGTGGALDKGERMC